MDKGLILIQEQIILFIICVISNKEKRLKFLPNSLKTLRFITFIIISFGNMNSFLAPLLIFFLICCSKQQDMDFSDCDLTHPFRLITRMTGQSLYAPKITASSSNLILDLIGQGSLYQDVWVNCAQTVNGAYVKNVYNGLYLTIDTQPSLANGVISGSPTRSTLIQLDIWHLVPGYTLVLTLCLSSDCIGTLASLNYEGDVLQVGVSDPSQLWAQWNTQPLDPVNPGGPSPATDDCQTAFALQNQGNGLYLGLGSVYPYSPDNGVYGTMNFVFPSFFSLKILFFSWRSVIVQIEWPIFQVNYGFYAMDSSDRKTLISILAMEPLFIIISPMMLSGFSQASLWRYLQMI